MQLKEQGNRPPPSTASMRARESLPFQTERAEAFVKAGALGPQESTASSTRGSDGAGDV